MCEHVCFALWDAQCYSWAFQAISHTLDHFASQSVNYGKFQGHNPVHTIKGKKCSDEMSDHARIWSDMYRLWSDMFL